VVCQQDLFLECAALAKAQYAKGERYRLSL